MIGFEVLTAEHFRGTCCLHHQYNDGGSKYLWNVGELYQTTWCYNPENSHHHIKYTPCTKHKYKYKYIIVVTIYRCLIFKVYCTLRRRNCWKTEIDGEGCLLDEPHKAEISS
jgi:hypothetical protein